MAPCRALTDHSDIRESIHQTSKNAHLPVQILRPHIPDLHLSTDWNTSRSSVEADSCSRTNTNTYIDTYTRPTHQTSRNIPTGYRSVPADEPEETLLLKMILLCLLCLLLSLLLSLLLGLQLLVASLNRSHRSLLLSVEELLLLESLRSFGQLG